MSKSALPVSMVLSCVMLGPQRRACARAACSLCCLTEGSSDAIPLPSLFLPVASTACLILALKTCCDACPAHPLQTGEQQSAALDKLLAPLLKLAAGGRLRGLRWRSANLARFSAAQTAQLAVLPITALTNFSLTVLPCSEVVLPHLVDLSVEELKIGAGAALHLPAIGSIHPYGNVSLSSFTRLQFKTQELDLWCV